MSEPFDEAADGYGDLVQSSISFSGQTHDFFIRRKADALLDLTRRLLGDPAELTALDVGCGVGTSERHLADAFAALWAVEPSVDSVARATRTAPAGGYVAGSGTTLPFATDAVDLAFTINVLHHVEPLGRPQFVDEMTRVVRPGGLVVAFEHNPLNPPTRLSVARCDLDEDAELLWPRELRRQFVRAGLTPEERRYILFTPFDVAWQHRVERRLGRLPLGAQHYLVGRA